MRDKVELLAGHWTLAGDTYPNGPTEVSSLPFRDRVEAAAWAQLREGNRPALHHGH